jgi:replicative DNA helicase
MNLPNEINNLKRPPQSGEAELSLLGALLIDNNAWESIVDIVTENDFYNLENKLIFKSINDLLVKNKPADIVTVYDQLKNAARIEEIGGLNYLNELVNSTPSSANIKRYAEIVRDKALLRSLITS